MLTSHQLLPSLPNGHLSIRVFASGLVVPVSVCAEPRNCPVANVAPSTTGEPSASDSGTHRVSDDQTIESSTSWARQYDSL